MHPGSGTLAGPEGWRCATERVSDLAGEPHGDQPGCVGPAPRAFCTMLTDALEEAPRRRMRPYLAGPRSLDTPCRLNFGARTIG